jgi:hypothetical protein
MIIASFSDFNAIMVGTNTNAQRVNKRLNLRIEGKKRLLKV